MSDIIRRLKCNQPVKSTSGGKKFVVRACQGEQERIIRFGQLQGPAQLCREEGQAQARLLVVPLVVVSGVASP
jgi:hypothetical protein